MLRSRPDRHGAIAVSIHWLSAVLIPALRGSGLRAANALDAATKAGLLRFHIPAQFPKQETQIGEPTSPIR
ncbi:hypothetical protein [Rhizobium leguminosarum]|uniref:hypothetical protein n=1 Tax=Rhizobium leguminosarum TaxID=384 RepID=UPI0021BBD2F0|nr:hypothetical protein [Rhizobium leguminosarum]